MDVLFAFFTPGPMEMVIFGVIAVLLFGKRLPEVGRSLGKGIVEFKKGLNGVEDEIETASRKAATLPRDDPADRQNATAPKFEPPANDWHADPGTPAAKG